MGNILFQNQPNPQNNSILKQVQHLQHMCSAGHCVFMAFATKPFSLYNRRYYGIQDE